MADKKEIERIEADVAGTRGMLDDALKRLSQAVDGVIELAEPDSTMCPYVQKPCPLWNELGRLRKQNGM